MEAELLQELEAVDDAPAPAAAPDLGAAELHREHAVALEAPIADPDLLAGGLFLDEVSMMVGQDLPPNSRLVVSDFGSQPISSTRLPCCAIM
jgi:hypothetical protein